MTVLLVELVAWGVVAAGTPTHHPHVPMLPLARPTPGPYGALCGVTQRPVLRPPPAFEPPQIQPRARPSCHRSPHTPATLIEDRGDVIMGGRLKPMPLREPLGAMLAGVRVSWGSTAAVFSQ